MGNHIARHQERAIGVYVHYLAPIIRFTLPKLGWLAVECLRNKAHATSSIVDQNIDSTEVINTTRNCFLNIVVVGNVSDNLKNVISVSQLANAIGGLIQRLGF